MLAADECCATLAHMAADLHPSSFKRDFSDIKFDLVQQDFSRNIKI